MNAELSMTDSGVRRMGRRFSSWILSPIFHMAPKKKDDPSKVDWSTTGWRGFVTALLGYIAACISNLPPLGSERAEMREVIKRLEENQTEVRKTNVRVSDVEDNVNRLSRNVNKLVEGINSVNPAVHK